MKKASGNLAPKSVEAFPRTFAEEFTEAQQLQARLHDIVYELKATIRLLEENLQEARRSAQPLREARDGSAKKMNPRKVAKDPSDG
jgi:hypothetical protein